MGEYFLFLIESFSTNFSEPIVKNLEMYVSVFIVYRV